jgi:hypothetical protein
MANGHSHGGQGGELNSPQPPSLPNICRENYLDSISEIAKTRTIITSPGYTSLEQLEKGKADCVSDV